MWKKSTAHAHRHSSRSPVRCKHGAARAHASKSAVPARAAAAARPSKQHTPTEASGALTVFLLSRSLSPPPRAAALYARNPRTHACEYCKLYTRSSLGHYIVARQRCARSTVLYRDILPARDVSIRENVWATLSGGEERASEGTAGRFAGANAALVCAPEQRQMRCGSGEEEMLFDRFFLF